MRHASTKAALVLTALLATIGCGGGGSDDATKFVGNWTFNTGSVINATCQPPIVPAMQSFDLAGREVSITKISNSSIRVLVGTGTGCSVTFSVSGAMATANANQLCTLPVMLGGQTSNQTIMVDSWTLSLSGTMLATTLSGAVAICTAMGSGSLSMSAGGTDGGAGG
jgi:hypothetical protein